MVPKSLEQFQRSFGGIVLLTILVCISYELWHFYWPATPLPHPAYLLERPRLLTLDCRKRRIGNVLFNYASLLGIARQNNMTPVLPSDLPIHTIFHTKMRRGYFDDNFGMFIEFKENYNRACAYDKGTASLEQYNTKLLGYYQSWRYFENVKVELHDHLHFKTKYLLAATEFFNTYVPHNLKSTGYVRIGIHVRRKDVLQTYYTNYGFIAADLNYIQRALRFYNDKYQNALFVVCSDDIKWCQENIKGDNVVFSNSGDYGVDLAIMSLCDHMIITVGSFGWWAAWLANGTTVYYNGWPRAGSRLDYEVVKADYFPPHWIGL